MAEAADGAGVRGQLRPRNPLHLHRHEAQPHDRDHPVAQRLGRPPRILLRQDVDQIARQVRLPQAALHQAGEHRHSDLRRRLLRHRLQRSLSLSLTHALIH